MSRDPNDAWRAPMMGPLVIATTIHSDLIRAWLIQDTERQLRR